MMTKKSFTKSTNRPIMVLVLLIISLFSVVENGCLGFVQQQQQQQQQTAKSFPLTNHAAATKKPTATNTLLSMIPDPDMEAEMLTTMAHFSMDFAGLVASPSKSLLRLFAILGRICVVSADYITDHSVHPEELMIQLFFMSIAIKEMVVDDNSKKSSSSSKYQIK
jgi:hypothetical protein